MRSAEYERITKETSIKGSLVIGGEATGDIKTGVGFLDHMLILLEKHGGLSLSLHAQGDLEVDCHHTVEDTGIVLGKLLDLAAGTREGIKRYGYFVLPMDETLVEVAVDMGGRPYIHFDCPLPAADLGNYSGEVTEEFFRAVAFQSGMTLHINLKYGKNAHHIIEGVFKCFARALKEALAIDPQAKGVMSTKGCF